MARPPMNSPLLATEEKLKTWPEVPEGFSAGARRSWVRLGHAVMAGPGITVADLLVAETLAQVMARMEKPKLKDTTFAGLARLQKELLIQLGMSPQARKGLTPPDPDAAGRRKAEGVISDE
jgi:hypothetical protein